VNKVRTFAIVALMTISLIAHAAVMPGQPETFDSGVGSWSSDLDAGGGDGQVSLSTSSPGPSGVAGDDFLLITYDYPGPPGIMDPVISNTFHTGDYTSFGGMLLSFDFFAAGPEPPTASPLVFFQTESGGQWTIPFHYGLASVGTWQTIVISLQDSSWTGGTGTFADALTSVTAVGIGLEGNAFAGGTQLFGIDNWAYSTPEPGTMCLLAAAFLSLGITFRRSLRETLDSKSETA